MKRLGLFLSLPLFVLLLTGCVPPPEKPSVGTKTDSSATDTEETAEESTSPSNEETMEETSLQYSLPEEGEERSWHGFYQKLLRKMPTTILVNSQENEIYRNLDSTHKTTERS